MSVNKRSQKIRKCKERIFESSPFTYAPGIDSQVTTAEPPKSARSRADSGGGSVPMPTVMLGVVATVLIALGGSLAGAAVPGETGQLWAVPSIPVRPSIDVVVALAMFYAGVILLVRAWLRLRRETLRDGLTVLMVVGITIVWSLPLLVGPPLGSRDVYAYTAQGRAAAEGVDVYQAGPGELGDDPVLEPLDPIYLDAPVVYGPVFVALSAEVSERTNGGVMASVYVYRALAVMSLAVAAAAVRDLARRSGRNEADAMVLTIANPLVLLHIVSGAHNESLMLAFLMTGVAVGLRPRWRGVGIALCAFAATIKVPAVLGAAFLAWPWVIAATGRSMQLLRLLAAGVGTLAVIAVATRSTPWGWGWIDALLDADPVDAYLSITRLSGGAFSLLTGADDDSVLVVARAIGMLITVMVAAYLLLRGKHLPTALGVSLLVMAILHPTTQPWYLTWGLLLVAAASAGERNRLYLTTCAIAAFVVLPVGPHLGRVMLDSSSRSAMALGAIVLLLLLVGPSLPGWLRQSRDGSSLFPGSGTAHARPE